MPLSSAALAGIEAHGLRWRAQISFHGQTERLANADELKVGDCITIRDTVVRQVNQFLNTRTALTFEPDERLSLVLLIDDIEYCPDDPDDLKIALDDLYDKFDYLRICVVG